MSAARSTQMSLVNKTDQDLTVTASSLTGGMWTTQPVNVGAQATMQWMSESDGVMTGTGGSVTIAIGGNGDSIQINWDNPYVGSNKYSYNLSSPNYGFFQDGWSGNNAVITFVLENSVQHATSFRPTVHGFPFSNSWTQGPLMNLDLGVATIPIGNAAQGLCGGMVFAAVDYWSAGQPIPTTQPPSTPGDPLYDFIVSRLKDSFDLPNLPVRLWGIQQPTYPETGDASNPFEGLAPIVIKDSLPQIRSWIDQGAPSPICVLRTRSANPVDLGINHQVLVWAYQGMGNSIRLWIYNPNVPGHDDLTIDVSCSDITQPLQITAGEPYPSLPPVYCFLTTAYTKVTPPVIGAATTPTASSTATASGTATATGTDPSAPATTPAPDPTANPAPAPAPDPNANPTPAPAPDPSANPAPDPSADPSAG